ncbi:TPA: helix-turn-helix transcriptional regulator [Clostridium botulinum]|uniref:Helix-turn-helix transcriptional regulator n=1 Tax=Clostridium botulinum TaxID=1491 RepID=A0AA43Y5V3_CLOBO|nr:helix-turn-helix transcriptional regulator [Clostridium botulinum]NFB14125.1 transcriptional regulator [Clostridium botulinum]NFH56811.1 helix-turn-helix transcriptional regulator [Clostridium botulinum]NFH60789.1 helix-turn-helix transcriptional regulator [Clostridium botulinum]NFI07436.1 helix-turn-helix transcriptional regulator [Clostridium botulinum]
MCFGYWWKVEDEIVVRKKYPQVPTKVEYSLSEEGLSIVPIVNFSKL